MPFQRVETGTGGRNDLSEDKMTYRRMRETIGGLAIVGLCLVPLACGDNAQPGTGGSGGSGGVGGSGGRGGSGGSGGSGGVGGSGGIGGPGGAGRRRRAPGPGGARP